MKINCGVQEVDLCRVYAMFNRYGRMVCIEDMYEMVKLL